MTTDPERPSDEGLVGSIHRVGQSFLGVLLTRLEILSTEIGEERLNLTRLALVALGILFCVQVGLILLVLFFVLAVSNEHRLAAIGVAAGVLLLVAVGAAIWLGRWLKTRPSMFGTTMAELRKDRDRLRGGK